mgnify:CR=1 FL=1
MRNENRLYGSFRGLRFVRMRLPIIMADVWAVCPKSGIIMHKFQVNHKRSGNDE